VHAIQFLFLDSPAQAKASLLDVSINMSSFSPVIIAYPVSCIHYPFFQHTPIWLGHKRFFEHPVQKMG